jgi:hypothetical protein
MDYVYIVFFTTGEYEFRVNEISKIFHLKSKAEEYVNNMNSRLMELNLYDGQSVVATYEIRYSDEVKKEFGFSIDYNGASFYISGPFKVD